jgi:Flp pilus assembly protein TadG
MIKSACQEPHQRSGIAATEFAVVLPVVVIIFLGAISAISQISLRRNLQLVAYTAATGVSNSANSIPDIETHFEAFATDLGIRNADVSVTVHEDRIYLIEATAPHAGNHPIQPPGSTGSLTARCYVFR